MQIWSSSSIVRTPGFLYWIPPGPYKETLCLEHDWRLMGERITINPPLEVRVCSVCGLSEEGRWSEDLVAKKLD